MFVQQIALIPFDPQDEEAGRATPVGNEAGDIEKVAAAIQKQVSRDFAPIWEVSATVDVFPSLSDKPLGYWPILIVNRDIPGAAGVHQDEHGQPYAVVEVGPSWSLTASHEALEMLADPFGSRLVPARFPERAKELIGEDHGWVEFLAETCDPPESAEFAYSVDGILVSDFYTPHYFDSSKSSARYSFGGHIEEPRQVLQGGYLSWHNPVNDEWYQLRYFDNKEHVEELGKLNRNGQSWRSVIDAATTDLNGVPHLSKLSHLPERTPKLKDAIARKAAVQAASKRRATVLREQILAQADR
ncbi:MULTISPECIES: hypothetical protein [Protofrankia]|uniref:Uncharacterized protein n=1 Tax=Candidatus Protofrankia californiensis TaxID=1839754 RepID=A0A1C3NTV3_9ACTN|nr:MULTISPECIES: hypothetical protein [Protofrankia]SBW18102.1 hypothetical protein FDG2_0521 [Candidatus Protofrankia californiensis]